LEKEELRRNWRKRRERKVMEKDLTIETKEKD
jgi:hypothetical protein